MSPVGNWTGTELCTEADVTAVFDGAADLLRSGQLMSDYIDKAKEEIGLQLDADLKAQRDSISKATEADLKNLIANLTVLKDAAVHYVLFLLFAKNVLDDGSFNEVQRDFYWDEYQRRYRRSFHLLEFDADASGTIEDDEAADSPPSYRFARA